MKARKIAALVACLALALSVGVVSAHQRVSPAGDEAAQPARVGPPPQPPIIGGAPAPRGAYPWMAALVFSDEPDAYQGQYCGGSLIAPEWVLTAAHCVTDFPGIPGTVPPDFLEVVLGRQELTSQAGERVAVSEIIVHPQYTFSSDYDTDLALLRLAIPSSQQFISLIGPGDVARTAPGSVATVSGWGNTSIVDADYPTNLRHAQVPIVSNELCSPPYDYGEPFGFDGRITSNMLCAGQLAGGIDTCQGDSGGPLMVPDSSGQLRQAGVTSFGTGCAVAGFYGVYTRVSSFASWINAQISPQPFLTIAKDGPEVALPSEPFTYTLQIANSGQGGLSGVVVSDTLPAGATYIDSSDAGSAAGNVVSWSVGALAEGEVVQRTVTVSATGTVTNTAFGAASGGVVAPSSASVTTYIDVPRLLYYIDGPSGEVDPIYVGQPFTYTLNVENVGLGPNAIASDVVLSNTLPAGLTYVSSSDGGIFSAGSVRWSVAALDPGGAITRTLTVRAEAPGYYLNTTGSLNAENSPRRVLVNYAQTKVSAPELSISKSGPPSALAGEPITYTLTLSNDGDAPVYNLVISDTLPAGARYVTSSGDGTLSGGTVTWTRYSLAPGASASYTLVVTATRSLVNSDYAVTATDLERRFVFRAVGERAVRTAINELYLPVVAKP